MGAPPWPTPAGPTPKKRGSILAIALAVAVLALLAGGLAAWLLGR
jgi:hypothetical protein